MKCFLQNKKTNKVLKIADYNLFSYSDKDEVAVFDYNKEFEKLRIDGIDFFRNDTLLVFSKIGFTSERIPVSDFEICFC